MKNFSIFKTVLVFCVFCLGGCSFLLKEQIYIPMEGQAWKILSGKHDSYACHGDYRNFKNRYGAELQCRDYRYVIGYLKTSTLTIVGPPLVPIIPFPESVPGEIKVTIYSSSKTVNNFRPACPKLEVFQPKNISLKQSETWYGDSEYANCKSWPHQSEHPAKWISGPIGA